MTKNLQRSCRGRGFDATSSTWGAQCSMWSPSPRAGLTSHTGYARGTQEVGEMRTRREPGRGIEPWILVAGLAVFVLLMVLRCRGIIV